MGFITVFYAKGTDTTVMDSSTEYANIGIKEDLKL